MTYLVSACLLGTPCRYDGASKPISPAIRALMQAHTLIPICPEILGGLPTPRVPAERVGARVLTKEGADVTAAYQRGAAEVLRLLRLFEADGVILQEKSPSCGKAGIYDGSFSRRLIPGMGVTAAALFEAGVPLYTPEELSVLLV